MEPVAAAVHSVETLKKGRRPLRTQLVKRINELETELTRPDPDQTVIQVKLELIQKNFEKVDAFDQEIVSVVTLKGTEEEQDAEIEAIADYEEKFRTAKVKADNFLASKSVAGGASAIDGGSSIPGDVNTHKKTYKLPKIEIRKFDGDLGEWLGFWSQFQKIHEDKALHDSDKFQYLVQSMIPGTRAHKLVSSYPQSADNYPAVIAALKDRFGDKVLLTEVYVRQLLKLVIRNASKPKTIQLSCMYDELESHLRALETLGVTQEQSASFLYPLVESSLPEEVIRVWQRSTLSGYGEDEADKPVDERLKSLMKFLRMEVKGAERLSFVSEGFGEPVKEKLVKDRRFGTVQQNIPTAAGLFAGQKAACIFCDKSHESQSCVNAQSMPYGLKKRKILEKKVCLLCLKNGHTAKVCKTYLKCIICQKRHVPLMCPDLEGNKKAEDAKPVRANNTETPVVHTQLNCTNEVLLQTLRCVIRNGNKQKDVRILLDPGSQKSYILEKTAHELGAKSTGSAKLCHLLFGGRKEVQEHNQYEVEIENCINKFSSNMKVLGHQKICGQIPKMSRGPWMAELKDKKIFISDLGEDETKIELLIGADYYAKWLTGKRECLKNGLVALETCFGWTLSGRLERASNEACSDVAMQVTSMLVSEANISELWSLETIGIHDPAEQKTRVERELETKQQFLQTVSRSETGRYSVSLPWIEAGQERQNLQNNRIVAERRLMSMTAKLQSLGKYQEYQKVFEDWLSEDIIEVVDDSGEKRGCHYLPHRAVFKVDSLTTPVRPVFDASCKAGRSPSLNEMLEKGPNLLELLPTILLRFRENSIGVTADIRKAFQMIEVDVQDRDFLRFLWWEDPVEKKFRVYRHKRVVFGVNCSPFLLAAVIELHLKSVKGDQAALAEKLLKSLYVDNCATAVATYEEYEQFKQHSVEIMSEAAMHLRNWEYTLKSDVCVEQKDVLECDPLTKEATSKVLGLYWNKVEDTLSCVIPSLEVNDMVTKRVILSYINRMFDPVGFICPSLLPLKLILQSAWLIKSGWDDQLPEKAVTEFKTWLAEGQYLQHVRVARDMTSGQGLKSSQCELHTFCDASQEAYATVIYLRTTDEHNRVSVQFVMAKSRLAPVARPTIPRMELLACVIGARLSNFVRAVLNMETVRNYLWSDSTTALAWIKRNDEWGTFVGNRVREICSLTKPEDWRHVQGLKNPADLPSRGCRPKELLQSRWWEGPSWLYGPAGEWPVESASIDETEILKEQKRSSQQMKLVDNNKATMTVAVMVNQEVKVDKHWYVTSSSYSKNICVITWIRRFIHNARMENAKLTGNITLDEFSMAETVMLKIVQQEEFVEKSGTIQGLRVQKADDDLYHVKTKLTHHDTEGFRFPIILPSRHPLIDLLIREYHLNNNHAGTQFLISKIRERFWILHTRRTIDRVIRSCIVCLRHNSKSFQTEAATLPACRTEAVNAFQTTGVDLAGPLYLKNGQKAWLVLYTCAVYRCVHLDFVLSLTTEAFLNSLERFINIRGRPSVVYSDNGTNLVGAVNLFNKLDWKMIEKTATVRRIKWIFNPPSAAWWGGWWERLIRIVKDLLKRMLGRARLNYEQLRTCISHAENIVNERPLTVMTEDQNDLIPLTPAMFMRGINLACFPESALLSSNMQSDYRKRMSLQQELKQRFRNEYLSQLVQRAKELKQKLPKIGDVVLVGADNRKRVLWPMAKIVELIPGRDGLFRIAKVKTQQGILVRPIQRLYPLEISAAEEVDDVAARIKDLAELGPTVEYNQERELDNEAVDEPDVVVSRSGRKIVRPKRLLE